MWVSCVVAALLGMLVASMIGCRPEDDGQKALESAKAFCQGLIDIAPTYKDTMAVLDRDLSKYPAAKCDGYVTITKRAP